MNVYAQVESIAMSAADGGGVQLRASYSGCSTNGQTSIQSVATVKPTGLLATWKSQLTTAIVDDADSHGWTVMSFFYPDMSIVSL